MNSPQASRISQLKHDTSGFGILERDFVNYGKPLFKEIKLFHWYNDSTNSYYSANVCLFKANNRNTRKRCEICSKLKIKTPEKRLWRRSAVFIFNFEHT